MRMTSWMSLLLRIHLSRFFLQLLYAGLLDGAAVRRSRATHLVLLFLLSSCMSPGRAKSGHQKNQRWFMTKIHLQKQGKMFVITRMAAG